MGIKVREVSGSMVTNTYVNSALAEDQRRMGVSGVTGSKVSRFFFEKQAPIPFGILESCEGGRWRGQTITNVRDHSDTWLWSECPPSSAELQRSAEGVAAYWGRGLRVGGHAKRVSWRPPCWVQSPAQGHSVWLACSVAGRLGMLGNLCGACRGPRQSGVAWRRPAGRASPVPTSTAWSC